jgi:hypothetical protein
MVLNLPAQDRESGGLRIGLVMGSCERGNMSPGIIKCMEFLDMLRTDLLASQNNCDTRSWLVNSSDYAHLKEWLRRSGYKRRMHKHMRYCF